MIKLYYHHTNDLVKLISSLDKETEKALMKVADNLKNKTNIIIETYKIGSLANCNKLI